jgi:hypothetical protein
MNNVNFIVECIQNNLPITFLKYGDGEYICASKDFNLYGFLINANCDNDNFSNKLGNSIIDSFKYITKQNNIIIAKTEIKKIDDYFENLTIEKKYKDNLKFLYIYNLKLIMN